MCRVRLRRLLTLVCVLAPAGSLLAAGPDTTFLVSEPNLGSLIVQDDLADSGVDASGPEESPRFGASDDGRFVAFVSLSDALSTEDDDRYLGVFVRDRFTNQTILASRASGIAGAAANGDCTGPSLSDDGHLVAFSCTATNLDPADTDVVDDVYVRDLFAGTTTLVSRASGVGGAKGNGQSNDAMISGNGAFVAFTTNATNLDAPHLDTTVVADIYRRQLGAPFATTLVSQNTAETAAGNGGSRVPSITDSGATVAFESQATNFAAADASPDADIYVRDVTGGITTLVSLVNGSGVTKGNGESTQASIAGGTDGATAIVAFASTGSNLTIDDADATYDIFRRSGGSTATVLVSRANGAAGAKGTLGSFSTAISDNGALVGFVGRDAFGVAPATLSTKAWLRNVLTFTTQLVSVGPTGNVTGRAGVTQVALSGDGANVAFAGSGAGFHPDQDGEVDHIFLRATGVPTTELLSRPAGPPAPLPAPNTGSTLISSGGLGATPVVSDDGRYVAFASRSNALVADDQDDLLFAALYRRDLVTGQTILVSRASGANGAQANGNLSSASISADGSHVAFATSSTNLDPADTDTTFDVYVRDVATATTTLVSRADGLAGAKGNAASATAMIGADGASVVFVSDATNLVLGDANAKADIFVRNIVAATTIAASRANGVAGALGDNTSSDPSISADGRLVAFTSQATNLLDGGLGGLVPDVHVRDTAAGTTRLVSRQSGPGGARAASGHALMISADGSRVLFRTNDPALAPGGVLPPGNPAEAYVRELGGAETTTLVSRATGAGATSDENVFEGSISRNGGTVVFNTNATNLVAGVAGNNAYARLTQTGETRALSRATGATGATTAALVTQTAVSGDGDCAVFRALGRNNQLVTGTQGFALVPGVSPNHSQVYMRAIARECPKQAPETTVSAPARVTEPRVTLTFTADEPATFECRVGTAAFTACTSPLTLTNLPAGRLEFDARATDTIGLVDPTPAHASVLVATTQGATQRLAVSDLRMSPKRFKPAKRGKVATVIRLSVNDAATLQLSFQRLLSGRKSGKRCVAPTRKNVKAKRCLRAKGVGTISRRTTGAGAVKINFSGRFGTRVLKRGAYRLVATAKSTAGGSTSAPVSITFSVR